MLAMLLLITFGRRVHLTDARSIADIKGMDIICPRCAHKQKIDLGESRCAGCGVIFLIKLAEPRCPRCDYVLLDLRAGICPECGSSITGAASGATTAAGS